MTARYQDGYGDGINYGWNEAIETLRLLRYAKEEAGDMDSVQVLTEALKKMAEKETQNVR